METAVKKIMIDNIFSIREEENGITVYEKSEHLFNFYENLSIEDIKSCVNPLTASNFEQYISQKEALKSKNIQSKYPFYIGWGVSGTCNLDCIYCFARNKPHAENSKDIMATANHILSLNPLSVGLSGGEPTLNPRLPDILKLFAGKVSTVLNTNGTTPQIEKLIPHLQEAGTLVRLTIDSVDNDLLNFLRPPVKMPKDGYNQIDMIKRNTKLLIDSGVPFMVHTVTTQQNLKKMSETAEELIRLGVKRWHLYAVNYTEKCKDIYDTLKVTFDERKENHDYLVERYGKQLHITSAFTANIDSRASAVLLVDSTGRFRVDTVTDGFSYIGKNPMAPSIDEILEKLDYKTHQRCYLQNFWQD